MFIGVYCKVWREKGEFSRMYFLAENIVRIVPNPNGEGSLFVFCEDDVVTFETPSFDPSGFVELVMQARLRPKEFLPSLYVGKKPKPDDQPNSVQWSAKDGEKSST